MGSDPHEHNDSIGGGLGVVPQLPAGFQIINTKEAAERMGIPYAVLMSELTNPESPFIKSGAARKRGPLPASAREGKRDVRHWRIRLDLLPAAWEEWMAQDHLDETG